MLNEVIKTSEKAGFKLRYTDDVVNYIVENAYAPEFGARPLKRFIQKTIETQIAEQIIEQKVDPKIPYTLDIRDNVVQLNPFA